MPFPAGYSWASGSLPQTSTPNAVVFASSNYVTVADTGYIYFSSDGETWTQATTKAATTLYNLVYAGTAWVAVGDVATSATIYTSADADTWTRRTSGITTWLYGVSYNAGSGRLIAIGQNGVMRYSDNAGATWAGLTAPLATNSRGIAFGNGRWVAVYDSGALRYSDNDGATWSSGSGGGSSFFNAIRYVNGTWIALANSGGIFTSTDGATFTQQTSGVTTALVGVAWDGYKYVVTGGTGTSVATILTSPDLTTWTARTSPLATSIRALDYGSKEFVSGVTGGKYLRSTALANLNAQKLRAVQRAATW